MLKKYDCNYSIQKKKKNVIEVVNTIEANKENDNSEEDGKKNVQRLYKNLFFIIKVVYGSY